MVDVKAHDRTLQERERYELFITYSTPEQYSIVSLGAHTRDKYIRSKLNKDLILVNILQQTSITPRGVFPKEIKYTLIVKKRTTPLKNFDLPDVEDNYYGINGRNSCTTCGKRIIKDFPMKDRDSGTKCAHHFCSEECRRSYRAKYPLGMDQAEFYKGWHNPD